MPERKLNVKKKNVLLMGIIVFLGVVGVLIFVNKPLAPFTVTRSWLTVEIGDFQDEIEDGSKEMTYYAGGYDLLSFEEQQSELIAPDTVVYYAKAVFGWEFTCYTDLVLENDPTGTLYPDQVFVGYNQGATKEVEILYYRIYDWAGADGKKLESRHYYARFNYVTWNHVNNYHYDGHFPLTMSINDDLSGLNGVALAGATIKTAELAYTFTETIETGYEKGIVGDYNDRFTTLGPSEIKISAVKIGGFEDPGDINYRNDIGDRDRYLQNDPVSSRMNAMDLGVDTLEEGQWGFGTGRNAVGQNEIMDSPEITEHHASTAGSVDFDLPINIRPRIEVREQCVQYRSADISVKEGLLGGYLIEERKTDDAATAESFNRVTAVKITNQYVHLEFQTTATLVATVKFDHELSETELDDPRLFQGDRVWDEGMQGGDVDFIYQPGWAETFWDAIGSVGEALFSGLNWIITVIVLIAVIIIVIKVIPIVRMLLERRESR